MLLHDQTAEHRSAYANAAPTSSQAAAASTAAGTEDARSSSVTAGHPEEQLAYDGVQPTMQQHNSCRQYAQHAYHMQQGLYGHQRHQPQQQAQQYAPGVPLQCMMQQPMGAWGHAQYWKPAMPMMLQPAGYGYPLVPMGVPLLQGGMGVVLATPLSPQLVAQQQQQALQQQQQQRLQQEHQQQRQRQPQPPHPPNGLGWAGASHRQPPLSCCPPPSAAARSRSSNHKASSSSRRSSVSGACSSSSDIASTVADNASVVSLCHSVAGQCVVSPRAGSRSTALPEGVQNLSWAWLVDGILQQVVQCLSGHSRLQAFRLTCRHWKAVADQNVRQLAPSSLKPKDLVLLFPQLQVLELVQCRNVRNRDLFVLAQSAVQLRCLTLGDDTNKPWVTNRGLSSIGRMASLTSLALHDCNSITNNGMAALGGLRQLASLSLRGCRKLTNNGLEALQANSSLTSLNLHGCKRISDMGLAVVSSLPLQALSLGLTRVKDAGLAHLARLSQLTELHCTAEELTDAGVRQLSSLSRLATLALRECCEVTGDALLALLPSLPHLSNLNLYKSWEFGDEQLVKCCVHMLGLTSLDLRGTSVTDAGLAECTQLTNLRQLALKPLRSLADLSMTAVSRLSQLRSLALCLPSYSSALLEGVAQLPALRELDLSSDAYGADLSCCEALPSQVVSALCAMTHLTSIDLSRRPLTDQQLHELVKLLPLLRTLTIHGVPISDEQLAGLERLHPEVYICKRNSALETLPELATMLGSLSVT